MCQKMPPKGRNCAITHLPDKTAKIFAKILPKIGFFYTNIVGTLVHFCISANPSNSSKEKGWMKTIPHKAVLSGQRIAFIIDWQLRTGY